MHHQDKYIRLLLYTRKTVHSQSLTMDTAICLRSQQSLILPLQLCWYIDAVRENLAEKQLKQAITAIVYPELLQDIPVPKLQVLK